MRFTHFLTALVLFFCLAATASALPPDKPACSTDTCTSDCVRSVNVDIQIDVSPDACAVDKGLAYLPPDDLAAGELGDVLLENAATREQAADNRRSASVTCAKPRTYCDLEANAPSIEAARRARYERERVNELQPSLWSVRLGCFAADRA